MGEAVLVLLVGVLGRADIDYEMDVTLGVIVRRMVIVEQAERIREQAMIIEFLRVLVESEMVENTAYGVRYM